MRWWTRQRLKSRHLKTRLAVVDALIAQGSADCTDSLLLALKDDSADIRAKAAKALGDLRAGEAVEPLIALLNDRESAVRAAAIRALGRLGDDRATTRLAGALTDPDRAVSASAVAALDKLGWKPGTPEERAQHAVARGELGRAANLGAIAIAPLVSVLRHGTTDKRVDAIEALARINDARAIKPLVEAVRADDPAVRLSVIEVMGRAGDPRHLDCVLPALKDRDSRVRAAAVEAATRLGGSRVVSSLTQLVGDESWEVRHAAILCLGSLRDGAAAGALINALRDEDPDVREAAAGALGQIREPAAVSALVVALNDASPTVRRAAEVALYRTDAEWEKSGAVQRAVPELTAALQDQDYTVRTNAARLLEKLGVELPANDESVALEGAGNYKRAAAILAFTELLKDCDRDLRQAAAETLGALGGPHARAALQGAVQDSDAGVQAAALKALEALR